MDDTSLEPDKEPSVEVIPEKEITVLQKQTHNSLAAIKVQTENSIAAIKEQRDKDVADFQTQTHRDIAAIKVPKDTNIAAVLAEVNKRSISTLIKAESEAALRDRALSLSAFVTILLTLAQIYFCYIGKTLIYPDILWAVILAPWLGAGGSKVIEIISRISKGGPK